VEKVMPIKPEKKNLYPKLWDRLISRYLREKAGWKCELCRIGNGDLHPITNSEVVLTVHHINGDPTDNRKINLIVLCQRCHNKLDMPFRHKRKEPGRLISEEEATA